jgi:hypothetical protein
VGLIEFSVMVVPFSAVARDFNSFEPSLFGWRLTGSALGWRYTKMREIIAALRRWLER